MDFGELSMLVSNVNSTWMHNKVVHGGWGKDMGCSLFRKMEMVAPGMLTGWTEPGELPGDSGPFLATEFLGPAQNEPNRWPIGLSKPEALY